VEGWAEVLEEGGWWEEREVVGVVREVVVVRLVGRPG
jgi:hypothetical protein